MMDGWMIAGALIALMVFQIKVIKPKAKAEKERMMEEYTRMQNMRKEAEEKEQAKNAAGAENSGSAEEIAK